MLKKILIVVVALVAVFLIYVQTRPSTFHYERSRVIDASPETIFPYLNNQKRGNEWSPWIKLDPDMKQTFTGPESGVGASSEWDGDNNVGAGRSTIIASTPNESVTMKLEFFRPMEGVNTVDFTLTPEAAGTRVTWSMHGEVPFLGKLVGVFMDCEKMCGDQFDQGLKNLDALISGKQKEMN